MGQGDAVNTNGFLALAFIFCLGFAFGAIPNGGAMMVFGIVIGLVGFVCLTVIGLRAHEKPEL